MIFVNLKEKCLVDSLTGNIYRPECWETLSAYYAYLVEKGHSDYAQHILQKVIKGEKYISKMIEKTNLDLRT